MDLLFKVIAGDPQNPAQVGDTNFPQHYSGVNVSMAWDELQPAIRQATQKYVLPYVGTQLYGDMATKFKNDTVLTDPQKQTLEHLQDCIAFYSIYHILPEKNAVVASMGTVQNSPEGGSQPAPQWSWKAKRWSALENADTFLDLLLLYLEAQTAGYFDLWKNSTAYKVKTSSFFRHTADLDEYLNIKESRRTFISLIKYLRDVEEDVIRPLLCDAQFAALSGATLSDDNKILLAKVRKVVAYLGLVEAVPHHRIVIDGDGFRIVSSTDQYDDRRNLTNNTHEAAINDLAEKSERKGRQYLADLSAFLRLNPEKYPLWANSPCKAGSTSKSHRIVVSGDRVGGVGLF